MKSDPKSNLQFSDVYNPIISAAKPILVSSNAMKNSTTQLSTATPGPWLRRAQGPLNQSMSAQKSISLLVLIKGKHQRQRAQIKSQGPWSPGSATLDRLLDFSEFLFLHLPNGDFLLICTIGIFFHLQTKGL